MAAESLTTNGQQDPKDGIIELQTTLTLEGIAKVVLLSLDGTKRRSIQDSRYPRLRASGHWIGRWLPVGLAAAACLFVLLAGSAPRTFPGPGILTSWTPILFLTAVWFALNNWLVGMARRRQVTDILRKNLQDGLPDGSPVRILLKSDSIEIELPGCRFENLPPAGCFLYEDARMFGLSFKDVCVLIPKLGLDLSMLEAVRLRLTTWGLDTIVPPPRFRVPLGFLFALTCLLSAVGVVAGHWSYWANASGTDNDVVIRVRLRPAPYTVRINDEQTRISEEYYWVSTRRTGYEDVMTGRFKLPSAYGFYIITRHAPGYTFNSFDEERSELAVSEWGSPVAPSDAEATKLLPGGLLLTWTRASNDGSVETCASKALYLDSVLQVPGDAYTRYNRFMRLRFCSKTLAAPELTEWLVTAGAVLDADFLSRTQP